VAPLEPWEKVLVDAEFFPTTAHGEISCLECHKGVQDPDKEIAHTDLVVQPSEDSGANCSECHPVISNMFPDSLHAGQGGYWTVLDARSTPEDHPEIEEMFGNHCQSCHTSCGDCHVSQPKWTGGGFISGHVFEKEPSMTRNCTACHGSRVGNEYLGKHEDLKADVHFRQERMKCNDCHTSHEMHGQTTGCSYCHEEMPESEHAPTNHRYDDDDLQFPTCEACHWDAADGNDEIEMHQSHEENTLSCEVCHSISYASCDSCHVQISEETGNPFFTTEGDYLTFMIGRNPIQSEQKPYEYVTVRHIPVDRNAYDFYGEDLLSNFDALPTWAYSTPHNTQLLTPQAESCNACHGNADLFLTADKVIAEELTANKSVIVEKVPSTVEE
jgi:thiosulfate/3-mercaptopyruvate sulfurtransferase